MANFVDQVTFRSGTVPPVPFSASGFHGDWQTLHVPFQPLMPVAAQGQIRVIANANGDSIAETDHMAPTVAVIGEVSYMGFTAWVRNSDVSPGSSGLNWVAVAEIPDAIDGKPVPTVRLRPGIVQPQHFQTDGLRGDWRRWSASYGSRIGFSRIPVVVVSPTNQNVRVHVAAGVGVVVGSSRDSFNLASRNSDIGPGACNFAFLAVETASGGDPNLFVDTGQVPARYFEIENYPGDWQVWAVSFAEPFATLPAVFVTADNSNGTLNSYARAAVGLVFDVTTDGFTLAARNSDLCAGPVGFSWIAIGRVN